MNVARTSRIGAITMVVAAITFAMPAPPAFASGPTLHSAGSTWVQIALQQWTSDVSRFGLSVDYQGIGSTAGRQNYMYNLIDFAATEIPYQPDELAQYHGELGTRFRTYQYIPDVAGGTSFMYNLVDPTTGRRITNLRLTSATIAKVFTGHVTSWRDPAIIADNPGLNLPNMPLTPVVRSDSSGTSGQLSLYLAATQPGLWNPFAARARLPAAVRQLADRPTVHRTEPLEWRHQLRGQHAEHDQLRGSRLRARRRASPSRTSTTRATTGRYRSRRTFRRRSRTQR